MKDNTMTLENLLHSTVERAVLTALEKFRNQAQPGPEALACPPMESAVIDPAPLPAAAPAPLSVAADGPPSATGTAAPGASSGDLEADRAQLIALAERLADGRKVATALIRKHGPKFDGLAPEIRASVLAELAAKAQA